MLSDNSWFASVSPPLLREDLRKTSGDSSFHVIEEADPAVLQLNAEDEDYLLNE